MLEISLKVGIIDDLFPCCRQDWDRFESLSGKMSREFQVRRSVLLTRLNASVDSFLWSEQGQKNRDRILAETNHNEALDKYCFDQIRASREGTTKTRTFHRSNS